MEGSIGSDIQSSVAAFKLDGAVSPFTDVILPSSFQHDPQSVEMLIPCGIDEETSWSRKCATWRSSSVA